MSLVDLWRIHMCWCLWVRQRSTLNPSHESVHNACAWNWKTSVSRGYVLRATHESFLCWQQKKFDILEPHYLLGINYIKPQNLIVDCFISAGSDHPLFLSQLSPCMHSAVKWILCKLFKCCQCSISHVLLWINRLVVKTQHPLDNWEDWSVH